MLLIVRRKNRRTRRETRSSATLSTTNLTWAEPGTKPGLHVERPPTNLLSHGTAHAKNIILIQFVYDRCILLKYGLNVIVGGVQKGHNAFQSSAEQPSVLWRIL
jgi:hypothetical protein